MNETIKNYEVIAAIIILTREILVSGLREFLAKGSITMQVTSLSKLKTLIQMTSIAILLTGDSGNKIFNFHFIVKNLSIKVSYHGYFKIQKIHRIKNTLHFFHC